MTFQIEGGALLREGRIYLKGRNRYRYEGMAYLVWHKVLVFTNLQTDERKEVKLKAAWLDSLKPEGKK